MGKEVARDLVKSEGVTEVALADIDLKKAKEACQKLQSSKLTAFRLDASNETEVARFISKFDVVINALYYSFNVSIAQIAIKTGVHAVDFGGHIGQATDRILAMKNEAKAGNITYIPDLGVAPGMTNILAGYGAHKLDELDTIKLYVGGIPVKPEPPLEYNQVFSMEGVFDHYTDPSFIIRDGKKAYIPSLSEVEPIHFEKFGVLEAFHTAGGTSTLSKTFPNVKNLEYKTIRYPGHAEKFRLFVDLNLTNKNHSIEIDGRKICPRDVFLKVLDPIVELDDKDDVVLLRVICKGLKNGDPTTYEYEMITYKDNELNVTAMARATAYTVSTVACFIANGVIRKRGVYTPEEIVPGDLYIEEMAKRGIRIKEINQPEVVRWP